MIDLFRALEQALQSPEVRASREAVAALLAEDFREVGSSGKRAAAAAALLIVELAVHPPRLG